MSRINTSEVHDFLRKEVKEMTSSARDFGSTVKGTLRPPSSNSAPEISGLMDPVRFKRFLITLLKILIIIELVSALLKGAEGLGWGQFGFDLIVAETIEVVPLLRTVATTSTAWPTAPGPGSIPGVEGSRSTTADSTFP